MTGLSVEDIQHLAHLYTQKAMFRRTEVRPEPLQQRHVQLEMRRIPSCSCRGQMGRSGSGLFTGERTLEGNVQACITSATGEVPPRRRRLLNWTDFCITSCTRAKSLARTSHQVFMPLFALTLFRIKRIRTKTLELMNAIEFIVIQDMTMNDTALYADILLPACHWFETEDLRVRYYCNPYLLWNEKAVEPLV